MRKCAVLCLAFMTVLCFAAPSQVTAQSVFVGAGATFPTGDFADFGDGDGASTGWMLEGGVSFPLTDNGIYVFGEGMFGSNSHDYEGDKTNLLGGFAGIEYSLAEEGEAGAFFFGELGFLQHKYVSDDFSEFESSTTGFAFGAGAGYGIPLGETMNGWVLGRVMQAQTEDEEYGDGNTTFAGISVGISIGLGGN